MVWCRLFSFFSLLKSDLFFIQHFLGDAAVGTYRVAVNFADMMQRLPDVAGAVLLAKVVRDQDAGHLSLRVARGILAFSIVLHWRYGPLVRGLLGCFFRHEAAYTPLVWMLPGLVCLGVGSIFNTKLAGMGYPAVTQWAPGLAFAVNALLNAYLIPREGLRGAAWPHRCPTPCGPCALRGSTCAVRQSVGAIYWACAGRVLGRVEIR